MWYIKILISLALKFTFSYIYPKFDVLCYYKVLEQKIDKGIDVNWFWRWLFKRQDITIFGKLYRQAVPRYRILHALVLIGYWSMAWFFFYQLMDSNIWLSLLAFIIDAGIGIGTAFYFMLFERLYYKFSDTEGDLLRYQRENLDVWWLKRDWYFGKICFKVVFLVHVFNECAFWGGLAMYLTSLIFLII